MKAYVELLSGIVRVGPECDKWLANFDYAVGWSSIDGKTAVVKALVGDKKFTQGHARAVIKALADIGLKATWFRVNE